MATSFSEVSPFPASASDFEERAKRKDESTLLAEAKAGNRDAFVHLVNGYDRNIYQLAVKITRNHQDAEDVVQEALFKAYTNLRRFQGRSRFSTWLVRIAVNEALMKLRKRGPHPVALDEPQETEEALIPRQVEDWDENPEKRYAHIELLRILSEAVRELPPAHAIVFFLREVEDLSSEETAQLLGLSVSAVKSRLLRARSRVRCNLNKRFGGSALN